MSWFDKKSWALRRKIRDLHTELAHAEREGKYVVEQGLFFAELQEMGDDTIMVLGTADRLDGEEEAVIRNFLDRNGFSVENLKLDKSQKTLAAVEIIPPQELTRRVAKILKDDGYRLVDDSEQARPSRVGEKVLTLSGLIRGISALFASHVHQLIISTPIKMNMEGNRLLHWMPLIRDALREKATPDVLDVCREPFSQAYKYYYGKVGAVDDPEVLSAATDDHTEESVDVLGPELLEKADAGLPSKNAAEPDTTSQSFRLAEGPQADADAGTEEPNRAADAAFALANLYKSLIGASEQRRIRNAETVLDGIVRFFGAKSACLLTRPNPGAPFSVQSNSTGSRCMPIGPEGNVCTDTTLLEKVIETGAVTVVNSTDSSVAHPQFAIAPLMLESGAAALLYVSEPSDFEVSESRNDTQHLGLLTRVFREFPDLLISDQPGKS